MVFFGAPYTPVAPLGLKLRRIWRSYKPSAPLGLLEAGAQCAPYECTFSNKLLKTSNLWAFIAIFPYIMSQIVTNCHKFLIYLSR